MQSLSLLARLFCYAGGGGGGLVFTAEDAEWKYLNEQTPKMDERHRTSIELMHVHLGGIPCLYSPYGLSGLPRTDGFTPLWRRGRWLCLTAILVETLFSQVRRCLLTSRAKQHNNYTKKRIWSDSAVIDVPHTRGHLTSSAPEPQAAPCAATPAAPRFSPMLPKAPAFR